MSAVPASIRDVRNKGGGKRGNAPLGNRVGDDEWTQPKSKRISKYCVIGLSHFRGKVVGGLRIAFFKAQITVDRF